MPTTEDPRLIEEILDSLRRLEARVARLESHAALAPLPDTSAAEPSAGDEDRDEALEIQIGQNWFAKAGIVGLAVGIGLLLTFPYSDIPPIVPSLSGYVLVGVIFFLSRVLSKSFDQVSRYLRGGGMVLLYFTTLRLAHFSPVPPVQNTALEFSLLAIVVGVNLFISWKRSSPYLTAISVLLGCVTALLGEQAALVMGSLSILAVVVAFSFARRRWTGVLLAGTLSLYGTHLLWSLNNPVAGNTLDLVVGPELTIGFLLVYLAVLGYGTLRGLAGQEESLGHAFAAAMNGGAALVMILLLTVAGLKTHIAFWHMALSVISISLAVGVWLSLRSRYSTFVYAMLGYVAMSIAIVAAVPMPEFFVWLCWESVLVLITAVWFRSRFIVVANFLIYLIVFASYLVTAGTVGLVSISFGLVALLSARVLNWKKERLELRTEIMRNAYLGAALFVVPYALYHSVPSGFVSLSWLVVAFFYYIVSRLLRNKKYRWMALLTTIMAVLYVFVVDLVAVNPTLRIISFLVVGTALLGTSMVYARRRTRRPESNDSPPTAGHTREG